MERCREGIDRCERVNAISINPEKAKGPVAKKGQNKDAPESDILASPLWEMVEPKKQNQFQFGSTSSKHKDLLRFKKRKKHVQ